MDNAFPLMNTTAKVPMFPIDVPVVVQSATTWPQPRTGKISWTTRFGVNCYTFSWSEDDGLRPSPEAVEALVLGHVMEKIR